MTAKQCHSHLLQCHLFQDFSKSINLQALQSGLKVYTEVSHAPLSQMYLGGSILCLKAYVTVVVSVNGRNEIFP
jgi:hypothetical protein